jgi:hypothetical protein
MANRETGTDMPDEGSACYCGAQFTNGVWWTRMGGLGHEHRARASSHEARPA